MSKLFISHSSADKPFARKLAEDLGALGHTVWLDERAIKVGDVIPSKLEEGISAADYVVVVLTKHSVESGWVDREVKAKLWEEVQQGKIMVLPVMAEKCELPPFLKIKKYADFTRSYVAGLVSLVAAITPEVTPPPSTPALPSAPNYTGKISALLEKVQARSQSLAQSVAEGLAIAQEAKNVALEEFCRNELSGWSAHMLGKGEPRYREVECFISISQINMQYFGWGQSASNVINYMRRNPKLYKPYQLMIPNPVGYVESQATRSVNPDAGLMTFPLKMSDVFDAPADIADFPVMGYARFDCWADVLEGIRTELVRRLLDLLPRVEAKS
jgi:TIR domain